VISILDSDDTEQADLRGGRSPWGQHPVSLGVHESMKCDALIVGGSITGSLIAKRLTRQGLDVIIIDREFPGRGSMTASTSMLLWENDRSIKPGAEQQPGSRSYSAATLLDF
jgi:NADPH-dependent 2,4-dienoyl-CoA reductase/sulfur reductase-like enzyme